MSKKYELLKDETIWWFGKKLYRIVALRSFGCVKKSEKGGYIESESNLSQGCACWVFDSAKIYDDAEVWGDARVYGHAQVCGHAQVSGNAEVYGHAQVYGDARVYDHTKVHGCAQVRNDDVVCGNEELLAQ